MSVLPPVGSPVATGAPGGTTGDSSPSADGRVWIVTGIADALAGSEPRALRTGAGPPAGAGGHRLPAVASAASRLSWVLPLAIVIGLWQLLPETGAVSRSLLTPPSGVVTAIGDAISSGQLQSDLAASLTRAGIGFGIAVVVGIALGLAIGWLPWLRNLMSPLVEVFRQIPPLALLPVFILFLGLGLKAEIAMVLWATLWPILLNTITGASTIDLRIIKAARSLGARRLRLFWKVGIPGAMPAIVTGLRLGASYSLLVLVSAEMVGASSGIGYRILDAEDTFHIPEMYAYIVVLALLGLATNYSLLWLHRRIFPWTVVEHGRGGA